MQRQRYLNKIMSTPPTDLSRVKSGPSGREIVYGEDGKP